MKYCNKAFKVAKEMVITKLTGFDWYELEDPAKLLTENVAVVQYHDAPLTFIKEISRQQQNIDKLKTEYEDVEYSVLFDVIIVGKNK